MSTSQWALAVAAASFVVSFLLALRVFTTRPDIVSWKWKEYERTKNERTFKAHMINVANIGRAHAIVHGVGVADKKGVKGSVGHTKSPSGYGPNPTLPLSLAPGGIVTFVLPSPDFNVSDEPLVVHWIRRRRIRIRNRNQRIKAVVQVVRKVLPPRDLHTTKS